MKGGLNVLVSFIFHKCANMIKKANSMKNTKKRSYRKSNRKGKIISKKIRTNIKGYINPIITSLISTFINKLVFSTNKIIKSTDIYFLILSAMILFTYYYLHKH